MIYTLARTKSSQLLVNQPLERLLAEDICWYWVDFDAANQEEITFLTKYFKFNSLAIEDCLEHIERPKMDYYDDYIFFVFHSLEQKTLQPNELDVFVGKNYIVTFHKSNLQEINNVRQKIMEEENTKIHEPMQIVYLVLDKIVDQYFPLVYKIEDDLSDIDVTMVDKQNDNLIDRVFEIRTELLKLRRTISSMKELLYRILNSEHLDCFITKKRYFNDIYDHLLKLWDIVETNREVTSDVRDNFLSINSHKMNKIMTILTIISSIFIPLTFIVGVYGMNFDNMPELRWQYGYYSVMGIMILLGVAMLIWFMRKGWFNQK